MRERRLYLDLDGVFADFDGKVKAITGKLPTELDDAEMWKVLRGTRDFYRSLAAMDGAYAMWNQFFGYGPVFLSGIPLPDDEMVFAPHDKAFWVDWKFGTGARLITCLSKDKATFCLPGDVLLDDRAHYADKWRAAGGVFIVHDPANVSASIAAVHREMER